MRTAGRVKGKIMNARGFTILELIIVMGIMAIVIAIAAISSKQWLTRSGVEGELRTMHADLLQARVKAMQTNLDYFVVVTNVPSQYQIYEDTNNSGGVAPSAGDTLKSTTLLQYPPMAGMTIIINQQGIISTNNPVTADTAWPANVFFNTAGTYPEYDCFQLYPTRIDLGQNDGKGTCVTR